jgi:hypothetical protein
VDLYEANKGRKQSVGGGLYKLKLKHEHVFLTPYSKMRVDLAAEVYIYIHDIKFTIKAIT